VNGVIEALITVAISHSSDYSAKKIKVLNIAKGLMLKENRFLRNLKNDSNIDPYLA
jgi:hypothetical protein